RIVAVEANIPADAAEMIDARGKLVVPGLIDMGTNVPAARDSSRAPPCSPVSGLPPAHRSGPPGSPVRRLRSNAYLWIIPAAGSLTFSLKKFSSIGAHNSSRISPACRFQIFVSLIHGRV